MNVECTNYNGKKDSNGNFRRNGEKKSYRALNSTLFTLMNWMLLLLVVGGIGEKLSFPRYFYVAFHAMAIS